MKGRGIDKFATLLTYKKFPQKYLKDFVNFKDYITTIGPKDYKTISPKQAEVLEEKGFDKESIKDLSIHDASAIISSIIQYENRHGEWSVDFGIHKGKHIKDLPGPYLGFIANKNPYHPVFKLRKKWNEHNKGINNDESSTKSNQKDVSG
jgi:DNA-binding ferritin-like protein (Dps family)